MPLDFYKVQPHRVAILPKAIGKSYPHYSHGRGGRKIRYITRHHTAGIFWTPESVNDVWVRREASAHYLVNPKGVISQHVWDANTAWSNRNLQSNQETISIEHSNDAGQPVWTISEATLIGGARLAAALCKFYGLGRPVFGVNIRDHREFTTTSCPHHLAFGGRYHQRWMDEAQRFYDLLVAGAVHPDGTLKNDPAKMKGLFVSLPIERQEELAAKIDRIHFELTNLFQSRFVDENGPSEYRDTLVGYMLNTDNVTYDMHENMLPALWNVVTDMQKKIDSLVDDQKAIRKS